MSKKHEEVTVAEQKHGLLPCPFCGGEAVIDLVGEITSVIVCTECPANIVDIDLTRAIELWNTRTNYDIDILQKAFRAEFEEKMRLEIEDCINWADWLEIIAEEIKEEKYETD